MELKNSVSTNRMQFFKLSSLGVKMGTADMCGFFSGGEIVVRSLTENERNNPELFKSCEIWPSWSLGRLIEMCPKTIRVKHDEYTFMIDGEGWCGYYEDITCEGMYIYKIFDCGDIFDNLILCIEWLVSIGKFNE